MLSPAVQGSNLGSQVDSTILQKSMQLGSANFERSLSHTDQALGQSHLYSRQNLVTDASRQSQPRLEVVDCGVRVKYEHSGDVQGEGQEAENVYSVLEYNDSAK